MDDHPFANLDGSEFMLLITYRRSGVAMPTPVWFAAAGDRLFVTTMQYAGKVKRIRNDPRVAVAPSDRVGTPLGPAVEGRARVLPPEEHPAASAALRAKYGPQYDAIAGRADPGSRTFIEIAPL